MCRCGSVLEVVLLRELTHNGHA
eukprot:COSAG05_NODE_22646_length_263_cov_0.719512_1_plen_22_part_01